MFKSAFIGLSTLVCASKAETYFKETFDNENWKDRWVESEWKDDMGHWALSSGAWSVDAKIETGLQTQDDARFYGIAAKFDKAVSNREKDLVIQFSVKNDEKKPSFCGGGYIKLLPADTDLSRFGGDTPYYIMFGPDICGYDVSRIHLIFNHDGENLLKNEDIKLDYDDKNDLTHLYTLVLKPDNTYKVLFDQMERSSGNIVDGWNFPKMTMGDPTDEKPDDWVDEELIPDPKATKPSDWDDTPEFIADPNAVKPEDWDEEDDGEWEAPTISNPEFKGEWKPKMIPNPEYKGKWQQKTIDNPSYKPDVYAFDNIGAVGFELWIVNSGTIFDNIYVGDSEEEARKLAAETFGKIKDKQKDVKKAYDDEKKANEEPPEDFHESEEEEDVAAEKTEL